MGLSRCHVSHLFAVLVGFVASFLLVPLSTLRCPLGGCFSTDAELTSSDMVFFNSSVGNRFPICPLNTLEYIPCHGSAYKERRCPEKDDRLRCHIPAPYGYKLPIYWPKSRQHVRYANVPHKWLTVGRSNQHWIRFENGWFSFPHGGSKFLRGTENYIHSIGRLINIRFGLVRTAIDCGCGVASFGGYLAAFDILPISFGPEDSHKSVLFALERGIPALVGAFASKRLPYPSRAFDLAHCSNCLVPWDDFGGLYLIEVDRILRPGGYWVFSGPPINGEKHSKDWNRTVEDLRAEQSRIEEIAHGLCWNKIKQVDDIAIWQKSINHMECEKKRNACKNQNPDQAWEIDMEECLTRLPEVSNITEVAGGSISTWPERLTEIPPRIESGSLHGITPALFRQDIDTWKKRILFYKSLSGDLAQPWKYRNILDMNAHLGGFAAALATDPVWVMNVVPVEANVNTLGAIFERGLIGTYQNWCEAMSTYPRSYDFIHADSIFTLYESRCEMEDILLEMDRILRPGGSVIIVDDVDMVVKVKPHTNEMQWVSRIVHHENGPQHREKLLVAIKQY